MAVDSSSGTTHKQRGEKMKIRTLVFPALAVLLAASPLSFAAEPSSNKATAKDLSRKAGETGRAMKDYTVEERDEAVKPAKAGLDDVEGRMGWMERKLDTDWDTMAQAARRRSCAGLNGLGRAGGEVA